MDHRLEGYTEWHGHDPFEDYVGPLYHKVVNGECRCAMIVDERHVNGQQGVHGGMLMTFADYSLFLIAQARLADIRAVTVTFTAQFTAVKRIGEFVECTGEVVHETRGMLFMRGTVFCGDTVLLNFTSTLKKLRPPTQADTG